MVAIEVRQFFHAAHQLSDSEFLVTKQCAKLHGHTYLVEVNGWCEEWEMKGGMMVDFKGIKNIIDELDHCYINDIFSKLSNWKDRPTTAENIALYLKSRIVGQYKFIKGLEVSVCEGYKGPEASAWVHA